MKKIIALILCFLLVLGYFTYQYLSRQQLIENINQLTTQREQKNSADISPVAVVMTTYNRVDLLPKAIDSILNQTYTNFDFIIVDDGSTDSSLQLLYDYMKKDKRIRVYPNKKNMGISYSRNKLLQLVQNKYFAIMDSDDWSHPQRLEKHYAFMEKKPDITVSTHQTKELGKPNELAIRWSQKNIELADYFFRKCPISNTSTFIRTSFIKEHNLSYNSNVLAGEDYQLWIDILSHNGKYALIEEPLSQFRQHDTNKKAYYINMNDTLRDLRFKMCHIFGINCPLDISKEPLCKRLKDAEVSNRKKQYFTQEQMDYAINQWCPSEEDNVIGCFIFQDKFWGWVDYIVNDTKHNIVYRFKSNEKIDILEQTPDKIVLNLATHKKVTFVPHDKSECWISVKP